MIFGGTLGSAAYGSWTIYGTVTPPATAAALLEDFIDVDTRDRFLIVGAQGRFFEVQPGQEKPWSRS